MAIYHLNVGHISRSTGRSCVQSAAYITGEILHESRRDLIVNYQNRHSGIACTMTLAPDSASDECRDLKIWDRLENFEDEYALKRFPHDLVAREKYQQSARTAMTIVVALPKELSRTASKDLMEQFAKERFLSRGLIVTYAIHDDEGNPHGHLQVSRRSITDKGEISWAKDREICLKRELFTTRKLWADLANQYLEKEGFEERITERSFVDLGIDLEATKHRGWYADQLIDQGFASRIVIENEASFQNNKEQLIDTPETILTELTSKQATFTQGHLLRALQKRLGDDSKRIASLFERALQKALVVGEGLDGHVRYTSSSYKQQEDEALDRLGYLMKSSHLGVSPLHVQNFLEKQAQDLAEEQKAAVTGLTQNNRLSVLIGRAGSGKTTTLKSVAQIYENSGYRVIGTSLSALASQNLGSEAGIESKNLHSWLCQWERYALAEQKFLSFNSLMDEGLFKQLNWYQDLKRFEASKLTKNTVLIVDEAGMIGTRQWRDLLQHVQNSGAKLILVGDDHQFKAIEAGDFFRELKKQAEDSNQLFTLQTIRRQKEDWMREASQHLADLSVKEALSLYEQRGHLHQTDETHLASDIATLYRDKLRSGTNGFVLAFTNDQTQLLNQAIRERLRRDQRIAPEDSVKALNKSFALGDKILFLKNDKQHVRVFGSNGLAPKDTFIKNGTTGILEGVQKTGEMVVGIGNDLTAVFHPKNYTSIDYGYALTTHKSQGQTVDFTIIAASKIMDAKGLYVAMTRHRDDVQLFYTKNEFKTFQYLAHSLSRFEHKDLVKDYTIRPEHEAAWQRVQEYKLCILDAASVLKDQSQEGIIDWQAYRSFKRDQIRLGKEILEEFDQHKLYLHQAGLTQEMLHITTGLKQRPLSLAEEKAKLTVELYGETAQLTRTLWRDIRSQQAYSSPQNAQFQELRAERDSLARVILENYPLHREFIQAVSKDYGITKKTLENQIAYREKQELKASLAQSPPQQKTPRPFGKTSGEIAEDLNRNIKELAWHFFGKPQRQTVKEWRYGTKGSIAIQVAGEKQGLYSNFATGHSGNAVTLIADQLGIPKKEAFQWGMTWLGQSKEKMSSTINYQNPQRSEIKFQEVSTWIPLYPIKAPFPDLKQEPALRPLLKGRLEVERFEYKDAQSNTLGFVVRLEDKDGTKIMPILTYCRNRLGEEQWRWQGFGNNRPLYGLEQLAQKPGHPVLVVEGEKTAEAAKKLFPDYAVVTWSGGCGAVQKSDWSVLKDRTITIWPDHDQVGLNAATKLSSLLKKQDISSVKIVDLPSTLPHKWDLADAVPEGVNVRTLLYTPCSPSLSKQPVDKVFSFETIQAHCERHHLGYIAQEENAPLMSYVAQETYQEIKDWLIITKQSCDEAKIQEQASLTGLYTAWAKAVLDTYTEETKSLKKALSIGAIAATLKMNTVSVKNDQHLLLDAMNHFESAEKQIFKTLENPSSLLQNCPSPAQEEIIRLSSRCKALTGSFIPLEVTKEFVKVIETQGTQESTQQAIRGTLDILRTEKADGAIKLSPVTLQEASHHHRLKEDQLQKSVQLSQDLIHQRDQQQLLRAQHLGERTL